MKRLLFQLAGLTSAFLMSLTGQAQNYSIDWFTIDGGGGTSTGGVYSVSGTVGQADAGSMSGGSYTLVGGFWGIIAAVQMPGAPELHITRDLASAAVTISWPNPSTGFDLQESAALGTTASWMNVIAPPVVVGANKTVTVLSPIGNRFYRLRNSSP